VAHEVVFAPEARDDLLELCDYIADQAGAARARAYTDVIVSYCLGFNLDAGAQAGGPAMDRC
jgi:plasmid stabilization system protein ParE